MAKLLMAICEVVHRGSAHAVRLGYTGIDVNPAISEPQSMAAACDNE